LTKHSADGGLNSCLLGELQTKPMEKPGKLKATSVLVPSKAEVEFYEKKVNKFSSATLE
jgi:hypothetical protein